MCSVEECFLGIGRDLASKGLEQSFGWVGIIDQLGCVLMKYGRQLFQPSFGFCRYDSNCLRRACFLALFFKDINGEGK
jgi:hypothetical protein